MTDRLAVHERHASWLELYFDLVFVVAIAQLAAQLAHDPTAGGFLQFLGLYLPVWWGWVGFAIYCARFAFDDWLFRVLMLGAMLGVAAMAVTIGSIESDSAAFALAYGLVRIDLVALYLLARHRVPEARELAGRFALGFGIAGIIWLASVMVAPPGRYWMWAAAMSIGVVLTPLLSTRSLARTPVSTTHVPERFGLFMIIVLGESVLAVVVGTSDTDWKASAVAVAIGGFVCAAALWWSYFDFASQTAGAGLLRSVRSGALARNIYSWGHFPIAVGLTLLGVGTELAIHDSAHGALGSAARWALCGGVALYLAATCFIVGSLARSLSAFLWPRGPAALAMVGIGVAGGSLPAVALVTAVATVLVLLVVLEVVLERRRQPVGAAAAPEPTAA
jgi:low temperature requirement protein LtrA